MGGGGDSSDGGGGAGGDGVPREWEIGTHVWIGSSNGQDWRKGQVVESGSKGLRVQVDDSSEVVEVQPGDPCFLQNSDKIVDDLTQLDYLHEPGLLENLRARYEEDKIYTYSGTILIAVNPFQRLPLYTLELMKAYQEGEITNLSPHVYGTAAVAYKTMLDSKRSQSILVSGESGAGKTESTKVVMKYLAQMASLMGAADSATPSSERPVEQQVLESNPLLEAFGNAKTVRNDNSSRFGKYVELQFDALGRISGAAIRTYLLERSRVVFLNSPERNFHIFYQLCSSPGGQSDLLDLRDPKRFRYLNQSTCFTVSEQPDEAKAFDDTVKALDTVGISKDVQANLFRLVAAVLHLGNISFEESKDGEGCEISNKEAQKHLSKTAELLGVDKDDLEEALTTRKIKTVGDEYIKTLTAQAAMDSRDTLAKSLYSRIFDWLVSAINASIGQDEYSFYSIGILDIYGFESFTMNSLEQLCINLTNERLQQHFNQHVFKSEQAEYIKEEINWSYIEFVDNQDALDLIEKGPDGIIPLLDEQCRIPQGSSENYVQTLKTKLKKHPRFGEVKRDRSAFSLLHYAGQVIYSTEQFLEKNKDYTIAEHEKLLNSSDNELLRGILEDNRKKAEEDEAAAQASGKGRSNRKTKSSFQFKSVGTRFKQQLVELMTALEKTDPHYIRCIKPNPQNKARLFDPPYNLEQLRCGGVLEAVRVTQAGFPTRKVYAEFADRFRVLVTGYTAPKPNENHVAISESVCKKFELHDCQLGKTKVFLRSGQLAKLDAARAKVLGDAARILQKYIRRHLAVKYYKDLRKAAVIFQKMWRGRVARHILRHLREEKGAVVIQSCWRMVAAHREYLRAVAAIITIQSGFRGMVGRRYALSYKKHKAAELIQAVWKMSQAKRAYVGTRKACVELQLAARSMQATKKLRTLKKNAKETGKLLDMKRLLEDKAQALTALLNEESEKSIRLAKENEELKEKLENSEKENEQSKKDLEKSVARIAELEELLKEAEKEKNKRAAVAVVPIPVKGAQGASAAAAGTASMISDISSPVSSTEYNTPYSRIDSGVSPSHISQTAALQGSTLQAAVLRAAELQNGSENGMEELEDESIDSRFMDVLVPRDDDDAFALKRKLSQARRLIGQLYEHDRSASAQLDRMEANYREMQEDNTRLRQELQQSRDVNLNMFSPVSSSTAMASPEVTSSSRSHSEVGESHTYAVQTRRASERAERAAAEAQSAADAALARAEEAAAVISHCLSPIMTKADMIRRQQELDESSSAPAGSQPSDKSNATAKRNRHASSAVLVYKCIDEWNCTKIESESNKSFLSTIVKKLEEEAVRLITAYRRYITVEESLSPTSEADRDEQNSIAASEDSELLANNSASLEDLENISAAGIYWLVWSCHLLVLVDPKLGDARLQQRGILSRALGRDNASESAKLFHSALANLVCTFHGLSRDVLVLRLSKLVPQCADPTTSNKDQIPPWDQLRLFLSSTLDDVQCLALPSVLTRILMQQLFEYIDAKLLNQLLLNKQACTYSNAELMVAGMNQIEQMLMNVGQEWFGHSFDKLAKLRQAITFLVVSNKGRKTLEEFTQGILPGICPDLNLAQVYRLCVQYVDDKYGSASIQSNVLMGFQKSLKAATPGERVFVVDEPEPIEKPYLKRIIIASAASKATRQALLKNPPEIPVSLANVSVLRSSSAMN